MDAPARSQIRSMARALLAVFAVPVGGWHFVLAAVIDDAPEQRGIGSLKKPPRLLRVDIAPSESASEALRDANFRLQRDPTCNCRTSERSVRAFCA
jgi:hypothetical protein